ncbi:hypothetical protein ACIPSA_51110 [Streptomyces sp. NPDC086549]|uniref:hypothetical protein n=1 Tax=Streptomyces sp. NPDC086549 TaxID=3365752 RepID=UPI0037F930C2
MEPQAWRPLGIVWRPPTPAIILLATVQFWLLLHPYGFRTAATIFAATIALDCIRLPRKKAPAPTPVELRDKRTSLAKHPQRERHDN